MYQCRSGCTQVQLRKIGFEVQKFQVQRDTPLVFYADFESVLEKPGPEGSKEVLQNHVVAAYGLFTRISLQRFQIYFHGGEKGKSKNPHDTIPK